VLGLAQVQAVHVPTGARSVAVRHAQWMRGCCQLWQEAIQTVTTGSWIATTQKRALMQRIWVVVQPITSLTSLAAYRLGAQNKSNDCQTLTHVVA
jgi:hypothetical protein